VATNGVTNRLVVVQSEVGYEVLAGNQRLKAAKAVGQKEVPVEVISTDDPISVMLADNVLGRPRTKSAIALQVFMYYRAELMAGDAGKAQQVSGLKKGNSRSGIIPLRENIGVSAQSLSDKYGFDEHLLLDLADIWRMCQECSDRAIGDDTWTQAVAAIASGECSTSRAKAGVGGRQGTLGKKRRDPNFNELLVKSTVSLGHAWEHWDSLQESYKDLFLANFSDALQNIPEDGVLAIGKAIPQWSQIQAQIVADAAAEKLGMRLVKINTRKE
jgi:hypothetical protein